MKKNNLFLSFLQYDWWKIAGVFLLAAFSLGYVFNQKDKLKDEEILDVFVVGEAKDLSFQERLYKEIEGHAILAIHSSCYASNDAQFASIASVYLSGASDLFLLPESVLFAHEEYLTYAQDGDEATLDKIDQSLFSFYDGKIGKNRGIKVFDSHDPSYNEGKEFASWFDFEETTYLFVSSKSSNVSSKGEAGPLLWECAYAFLMLGIA